MRKINLAWRREDRIIKQHARITRSHVCPLLIRTNEEKESTHTTQNLVKSARHIQCTLYLYQDLCRSDDAKWPPKRCSGIVWICQRVQIHVGYTKFWYSTSGVTGVRLNRMYVGIYVPFQVRKFLWRDRRHQWDWPYNIVSSSSSSVLLIFQRLWSSYRRHPNTSTKTMFALTRSVAATMPR